MIDEGLDPVRRLERMSDRDFLAAWKRVFGQVPAAMLERAAMIELLLGDGPGRMRHKLDELERLRASIRAERERRDAA